MASVNKEIAINYHQLIRHVRTKRDNIILKINDEPNEIYKALLCREFLSPQQSSGLLKKYIISSRTHIRDYQLFTCLRVSLGYNNTFHFVQLHPNEYEYFYFYCYTPFEKQYGKIYEILLNREELIQLICEYGSYSHGTIRNNGPITKESIRSNAFEYSIKPRTQTAGTKPYRCWKEMLKLNRNHREFPFQS